MKEELGAVHKKLNDVSELATQGKTSLKTLLWLGGVVAGVITVLSILLNMLPR